MTIILASKSPRRKQLLEWAEIPFNIITTDCKEDYPPQLTPALVATHIAKNKATGVLQKMKADRALLNEKPMEGIPPILAADTIVVMGETIIGKPADKDDAVKTLQLLSGKTHEVITGVCILYGEKEIIFFDTTLVEFHSLTDAQINYYVDHYKPYDKAGAYAIQEWIGVIGIKSIRGDFYNVMGLPVSRVVSEIMRL